MPFEILENFQKLDPISRIQECLDPFESLVMRLKMCVKLLYKLGKCIYLWMRVKRNRRRGGNLDVSGKPPFDNLKK